MGVNRNSGGGRAWYPSGPKLDGSSGQSYTQSVDLRNPDPKKFTIIQSVRVGDWFVTKIQYPNCTNYEGNKIIVTDFNPKNRTELDPHFTKNSGIIARFVPTDSGWNMATNFAKSL
jgi:hypothetical protein